MSFWENLAKKFIKSNQYAIRNNKNLIILREMLDDLLEKGEFPPNIMPIPTKEASNKSDVGK